MELVSAYKFRIYPDATRQGEIDKRLILAQQFYNKILEKSIASYQNGKTNVTMARFNRFVKEIIQEDKKYPKLCSQTRCEIEYRLLKVYSKFFDGCKAGNHKAGFPCFKPRDRYKSLTSPQDNGSAFKIETRKKEGLNTFAMLSDSPRIEKPKFARKKERKIAHWHRVIAKKDETAKKQKGDKYTRNRKKAAIRLQDAWNDVNDQNHDFMQKSTTKLINSGDYTSFKMEALQPLNMMKNHKLARSIGEASWPNFRQILSYKAESAGMEVSLVDPTDTTQECSICHNIKKG